MGMMISVQICSYNRSALLKKALEGVFRQDFPTDEFEIILVDDGSTDDTAAMVKTLSAPCRLEYLYQPNSGLATARNRGIRAAGGKYVLFIDDDIMADPHLLKEHLDMHLKYPGSVVNGWVNHVEDLEKCGKPRFTMADISTSFFWTSNVSVRREDLEKAGLFDESFREYGWEDLELGVRLRNLGLKSRFNRHAVVYHYKKKWNRDDLPRHFLQAEAKGRTAVVFLEKHPTLRVRLATGIYPWRFFLNSLFYFRGHGERFFKKLVESAPGGNLEGLYRFAAQKLIDFHYFEAVRKAMAETGGK